MIGIYYASSSVDVNIGSSVVYRHICVGDVGSGIVPDPDSSVDTVETGFQEVARVTFFDESVVAEVGERPIGDHGDASVVLVDGEDLVTFGHVRVGPVVRGNICNALNRDLYQVSSLSDFWSGKGLTYATV